MSRKKSSLKGEVKEEEEVVEINIDSTCPLLKIEEYPEFSLPEIECLPFVPPWEEWPEWPPPSTWKYPEPFDSLLESCLAHKLPPDINLSYGPPYPWIFKRPSEPPKEEPPLCEYLMAKKVYDLILEAMQLIVIERPERPVKFVALYLREKNPLACKVKCRRHCHLGETCHCKNLPPPPPPPPEPEPEPDEGEGEGEEAAA